MDLMRDGGTETCRFSAPGFRAADRKPLDAGFGHGFGGKVSRRVCRRGLGRQNRKALLNALEFSDRAPELNAFLRVADAHRGYLRARRRTAASASPHDRRRSSLRIRTVDVIILQRQVNREASRGSRATLSAQSGPSIV